MNSFSAITLSPLSAIYSMVTRARLALYRRGILPVSQLGVPVISVGNITTGGTGKTPVVEWIAGALGREGRKVCILTRGYGRTNPRNRVIVAEGKRIRATPAEAGDEAVLLAKHLNGLASVISDADRAAAGEWAIRNWETDAFVLDDGFQHVQMARNLDVVTIDATNPWGKNALLPRGRLREPLTGLRRADCIVITRSDQTQDLESIRAKLSRLSGGQEVFHSRMQTRGFFPLAGFNLRDKACIPENPVAAFCGIGNPQSFFNHLGREGVEIHLARTFPDHHSYTQSDLDSLSREAEKLGIRSLVTTAKDAVKLLSLNSQLPCYVLEIEVSVSDEVRFLEMVRCAISKKEGNARS